MALHPMTAAEAAYNEALKRIRAAKETGQNWLDLGDIEELERIPEEIGELTELRELGLGVDAYDPNLKKWEWDGKRIFSHPLADLGPLSGLSELQTLIVSYTQLSELGPLSGLSALQTLHVNSTSVSDLGPLSGLSALQTLNVSYTKVSRAYAPKPWKMRKVREVLKAGSRAQRLRWLRMEPLTLLHLSTLAESSRIRVRLCAAALSRTWQWSSW